MFSGNDDMVVPLLSLGASGVISVWANVQPAARARDGGSLVRRQTWQARPPEIQVAGLPLVRALFSEVNPIPVKEALAQMGLHRGSTTACRSVPMAEGARARLVDRDHEGSWSACLGSP